ncbi:MAG: hypothetical protein LC804_12115 [Acidobacteria bacterium]|nr:hypothetical protein [Acidobacteriota bacterium]
MLRAALLALVALAPAEAFLSSAQPAANHMLTPSRQSAPSPTAAPAPPRGAVRLVNYDRHGSKVAMCGEMPAAEAQLMMRNARRIPPTQVWIDDGGTIRKVVTGLGACDPAWSPDGARLALTAPDGVWVIRTAADVGERLVDASRQGPADPSNEFDYVSFSKVRWAPDGTRLAFVASNGGTSWIEVVDAASGDRLFRSEAGTSSFTWGADSRSLDLGGRTAKVP